MKFCSLFLIFSIFISTQLVLPSKVFADKVHSRSLQEAGDENSNSDEENEKEKECNCASDTFNKMMASAVSGIFWTMFFVGSYVVFMHPIRHFRAWRHKHMHKQMIDGGTQMASSEALANVVQVATTAMGNVVYEMVTSVGAGSSVSSELEPLLARDGGV
ncbi:hypothetical protein JYT19_00115 [Sulfobacillus acidophilus]|uniref:Transmembrane protein n=1 Tax=Sulfobacillus acidophilus TaxID=53633 RepID=A0ABS3AWH7_9FIRM|nr:hypothetical protein [Sulfobacillus acidophilus]